jgi:uncharacterized protein (TIGR02147 family)
MGQPKASVFEYLDFYSFFSDVCDRLLNDRKVSQAQIANAIDVTPAFLSMLKKGRRLPTAATLNRFLDFAGFEANQEREYCELLFSIATNRDPEFRLQLQRKLVKLSHKQGFAHNESTMIEYLSQWYIPVIRELALSPGFRLDPRWVQSRLPLTVSLSKISRALDFLCDRKLIAQRSDASWYFPGGQALECDPTIYGPLILNFHREMLSYAAKEIGNYTSSQRWIQSLTIGLTETDLAKIFAILSDAIVRSHQIAKKTAQRKIIYNVGVYAMPVSKEVV